MTQSMGDLIDSLGVTHEPREGELACDAIVILKIIDAEGDVALRIRYSESSNWIERIGMLRAAEQLELPPFD
jgi:hypothetical protein